MTFFTNVRNIATGERETLITVEPMATGTVIQWRTDDGIIPAQWEVTSSFPV